MEGLRAALGDHLNLPAHGAAVLGLVGVGQDLELGDGVDVGLRHVAAVVAGVDVGDAVDRHVVRVRALPVHDEVAHLPVRALIVVPGGNTGYQRREVEHRAPVVRDVLERLALERVRALTARRLQLAHAAGDAHLLRDRADLELEDAGEEAVVGVDLDGRPLERLEALHADAEDVVVGPDDREDEAAFVVRGGCEGVCLGLAGERHGCARQHASLDVLHLAEDGCAGRLRAERRDGEECEAERHRDGQGGAGQTSRMHEPPLFPASPKSVGLPLCLNLGQMSVSDRAVENARKHQTLRKGQQERSQQIALLPAEASLAAGLARTQSTSEQHPCHTRVREHSHKQLFVNHLLDSSNSPESE